MTEKKKRTKEQNLLAMINGQQPYHEKMETGKILIQQTKTYKTKLSKRCY